MEPIIPVRRYLVFYYGGRCNGSIERARLYVESQLGYGCELTMMETERRYTGNGKSSVHYHIVRV